MDGAREMSVKTSGTAVIIDVTLARDLALAGIGIACLFEPLVRKILCASRLLRILPQSGLQEEGLFLYFPKRASLAPKLRAFIDAARA